MPATTTFRTAAASVRRYEEWADLLGSKSKQTRAALETALNDIRKVETAADRWGASTTLSILDAAITIIDQYPSTAAVLIREAGVVMQMETAARKQSA